MHIPTLFTSLLATSVLAAPKPRADPQYNQLAPAVQSTAWVTSVVWITTTEWQYPSSTSSSVPVSSTTIVFLPPSPSPSPSTTLKLESSTLLPVASPSPSTEPSLLGGVYICEDINWSGSCTHYLRPLGSGPDDCVKLHGDATSVGPDEGVRCTFFTNSFCDKILSNQTDFLEVGYPGIADLRSTDKGDLNDSFWSYVCLKSGV